MNNPIIMHVNYCEQGQTIEEMCKKAVKWGFDGIEFRAKRNGVEETREDYIDEVAKAQKVSGLKYVLFSLNMVNVMDPCPEKRKAAEDDAIDFMKKAAAKIKCTTFNAFAGGLFNEDDKLRENWSNNGGNGAARGCHWRWATLSLIHIYTNSSGADRLCRGRIHSPDEPKLEGPLRRSNGTCGLHPSRRASYAVSARRRL